mmetsp:Transcript_93053/g.289594  ORF Transcript_93053/g.289594 Transcript_93053/m.289594 type:complete len:124 (-) Transcript_93053:1494-1865(-)
MDWRGRGYCTPADFAGGENPDVFTMLKQLVDEHTVRKVLGSGNIRLERFLELMCEDEFRGHEESTQAIRKDGSYVTKQVREGQPRVEVRRVSGLQCKQRLSSCTRCRTTSTFPPRSSLLRDAE